MKKNWIKSDCPNCQPISIGGGYPFIMHCPVHAAAPELLAVLKTLSDFLTGDDCPQPLWDRMHNVIAAAEVV